MSAAMASDQRAPTPLFRPQSALSHPPLHVTRRPPLCDDASVMPHRQSLSPPGLRLFHSAQSVCQGCDFGLAEAAARQMDGTRDATPPAPPAVIGGDTAELGGYGTNFGHTASISSLSVEQVEAELLAIQAQKVGFHHRGPIPREQPPIRFTSPLCASVRRLRGWLGGLRAWVKGSKR